MNISLKSQSALLLTLLLTACQQEPLVTLNQHNALQSQVNQLSSRLAQLEQQQQNVRHRVEEVSKSRLVPTGVNTPSSNQQSAFEVGESAYHAGRADEALAALESYLAQNPNGEKALLARYFVGDLYYMRHNYDYAARYFGEFLSLVPNHSRAPYALQKLIQSLEAQGRHEDAQVLKEQGVSALQR